MIKSVTCGRSVVFSHFSTNETDIHNINIVESGVKQTILIQSRHFIGHHTTDQNIYMDVSKKLSVGRGYQ